MSTPDVSAWLKLSHCDGPGADQYLARALADPLCGGSRLIAVSPVMREGRIDFVLARNGGASREIVRAVLDERGRPTTVEVWLVHEPSSEQGYGDSQRLGVFLQGTAIVAIAERDGAVIVTTSAGKTAELRADGSIVETGPRLATATGR